MSRAECARVAERANHVPAQECIVLLKGLWKKAANSKRETSVLLVPSAPAPFLHLKLGLCACKVRKFVQVNPTKSRR